MPQPKPPQPSNLPQATHAGLQHGAGKQASAIGLVTLLIALPAAMLLAVAIGSVPTTPAEVLGAVGRGLSGNLTADDSIVWDIRLPRALMAVLVGACLSVCGGAFQGVFRNPLADPYLLGAAGGAAAGASGALLLGVPAVWVPACAMFTALAAVVVTLLVGREGKRYPPTRLILAGVVVSSLTGGLTTLLILSGEDRTREVLSYTIGNLAFASWRELALVLPYALVGGGILMAFGRALDLLQLGDLTASSLGLPVERLRLSVIVAASVVTAAAVAFTGIIGFVGLIVPHAVRLVWGGSYRAILPVSALAGGTLLVLADLLARTTPLYQVGIVTTLLGGPFFLYLLRQVKT